MRLSHERWFSRDGQRRLQGRAYSQSSAFRKVVALSFLLAMIVVAMQQLSDPKKYEPAFTAIGLTQTTQPSKPAERANPTSTAETVEMAAELKDLNFESPSFEVDRAKQVWLKLLRTAGPETLNELSVLEFAPAPKVETGSPEPTLTEARKSARERFSRWLLETEERLSSWPDIAESTAFETNSEAAFHRKFVEQWRAWSSLHQRSIRSASSALDDDLRTGFRSALDELLLGLIKDAEPWRPVERWALARTLQRAAAIRASLMEKQALLDPSTLLRLGPSIEVQLLLKQTKELRGRIVRFRGSPASNPDASILKAPDFPHEDYEVVWMRPDGFSTQPVCVYQLKKAAPRGGWPTIKSSDNTSSDNPSAVTADETPLMEVTGILVKRLAYPSQRGIDVAPLLVTLDAQWVSDFDKLSTIVTGSTASDQRYPRWVEPGERERELNILREIFASNLEALRDDEILKVLTGPIGSPDSTSDVRTFQQLALTLSQMPRVESSLRRVLSTEARIGPGKLGVLKGWVTRIEAIVLENARDEDGRPMRIYRMHIESTDEANATREVPAFVNHLPREWRNQSEIRQPIELHGLRLEYVGDTSTDVFWIADHPHWSWSRLEKKSTLASGTEPKQVDFIPTLDPSWMRLGSVGFDLGWAETIRKLSKQVLVAAESEAFYSLIDAADRISKNYDSASADDSLTTAQTAFDCLDESTDRTLRMTNAKVHVVRATRIAIESELLQDMLGGDHYYELDGLVDIQGHAVRLKSTDGQVKVDFEAEYPITLVSKALPPWLFTDGRNTGRAESSKGPSEPTDGVWYPRKTIEVDGFFYRLWSYTTSQTRLAVGKTTDESRKFMQNGPLIAVTGWKAYRDTPPADEGRSVLREVLLGLGITGVCLYVWYRFQTGIRNKTRRKAA